MVIAAESQGVKPAQTSSFLCSPYGQERGVGSIYDGHSMALGRPVGKGEGWACGPPPHSHQLGSAALGAGPGLVHPYAGVYTIHVCNILSLYRKALEGRGRVPAVTARQLWPGPEAGSSNTLPQSACGCASSRWPCRHVPQRSPGQASGTCYAFWEPWEPRRTLELHCPL